MEDWMRVDEIARELGVCRNTVYRALERGQLPARRVASRWVVHRTWFDRWMQGEPGFWSEPSGERPVVDSPHVRRVPVGSEG